MNVAPGNNRRDARHTVRALLLTALAFFCLLVTAAPGRALSGGDDATRILLPDLQLPAQAQFALPTLSAQGLAGNALTPLVGKAELTLGRKRKLSFDGFAYGGKSVLSGLKTRGGFGLADTAGGSPDPWSIAKNVPTSALALDGVLDDQAQRFKVGLDAGRATLSLSLQNVGAKFTSAASALQGVPQEDVKALVDAAGTRNFALNGSFQLSNNATFTSSRTSLYNDKPGDGNRGRTTTDWVNALSMNLGKSSSLRFALTDHNESWDPGKGKTDSQKRTTEIGGETKFGRDGKYGLRFGLTETTTGTGGNEQTEKNQELHLVLPLHARLRLNADYTRHEDAAGKGQTTSFLGSVFQLYPGAELTANWKTMSLTDGKRTQETFLKFTGGLGHGASTLQLAGEQTSARSPDSGMVTNSKFDLTGGYGKGAGRLNLHAVFAEKRGDLDSAPLERTATLHVDRAFGPRLNLTVDGEQKLAGTTAAYDSSLKSVTALTATLGPQTKLIVGGSTQEARIAGQTKAAWSQDATLEHHLGQLLVRAEEHRRADNPDLGSERLLGVDWSRGGVPDWANGFSRHHEFGDIYEYKVAKEANWLDTPFLGTRLWMKQRAGGPDDGVSSFLVSHRAVLAKRFHLQLTYHEFPEYEDGDKKGRPQPLHRQYAELGTRLKGRLLARAWFSQEQRVDDLLSLRRTLGLGLSGKLANQAQAELYFSQDRGAWDSHAVERNTLALFYNRVLDDDHKLTVKLGYAWGASVGSGTEPDYRLTLAYANPM